MDRTIRKENFMDIIISLAESVYDFHERFDMKEVDLENKSDVHEEMHRKIGLQIEELGEFSRALNKGDYDNMCEEIIDNLYVALGTALILGHTGSLYISDVIYKNNRKTPDNYIARYYNKLE